LCNDVKIEADNAIAIFHKAGMMTGTFHLPSTEIVELTLTTRVNMWNIIMGLFK